MLATIVALLVIPLTMTRISPGRLAMAIAVLCISGSLAVAYVPETVVQRLATTKGDVEEGRLGGRLKIWVAGGKAFAKQPLLGYGTSGFKTAITPFLPTTPQVAHNSFLSLLVEQGMLGFLLYALMIGSVFRAVLGLPQMERRFGLVLLATLMVVMLPLTWEDRKPVWFVMAALLALAAARGSRGGPRVPEQTYQGRAVPGARGSPRQRYPEPLAALPQDHDGDATA
jgi:O-antigen ligase